MKKMLIILFILLLMPIMVNADIEDVNQNSDENITTTENVTTSPDTGVEDYFITLGAISICLAGTVYVLNKKSIFAEI